MRISQFFLLAVYSQKAILETKSAKIKIFGEIFNSQIFNKIYEKSLDFYTGSSR
jgi:hypothetical protein